MFMQCGIRFARILTRLEPFPPNDLAALVGFMASLTAPDNPHRAPDGRLTEAQERGRHFFERSVTKDGEPIPPGNRCITCHPPPLFTDRQLADVGTASPTSSVIAFDTPHLLNVYGTAPYLHDGRARTLEEIWTVFNPDDRHGVTRDMSKRDLNDLIDYLKTF
jgi:cytochrome c peroxidase